jgi:hypothetical protein
MATKISKGSFITLQGSKTVLKLTSDATIEEISDQTYVGALMGNKAHNWPLNVDNYEGNYNPVTGAPMPNECANCGREIPSTAVSQKLCEVCMGMETAERAAAKGSKSRKTSAKKTSAQKAAKKR